MSDRNQIGITDHLHRNQQQPADKLQNNSDELFSLLSSNSAVARARVIESLSSGWVAADLAKASAKKALEDISPFVRSAAARFLRTQSSI
jgi:hypothetical protein